MRLKFLHGWHNTTRRAMRAKGDTALIGEIRSDWLLHCMGGWRAVLCVVDNLVPHRGDPEEGLIGIRGFRWICRLHDWAAH